MKPITLILPYPISANRYWASRIIPAGKGRPKPTVMTYVTKEAEEYRAEVAKIAMAAGVPGLIGNRMDVAIRLFPHRPLDWKKRMRDLGPWWDNSVQCIDLGNCEKVLADALQGVIYTDDKWIWHEEKSRMEPDENGARVEIDIVAMALPSHQPGLFGEAA